MDEQPEQEVRHYLFVVTSTREAGVVGNTEWLARQAASQLAPHEHQTWVYLRDATLEPFVDVRHTVGTYPMPNGDAAQLLAHTLACTDLVFVTPVYWYSFPSPLKCYLDQWSAWLRIPGVDFKSRMSRKRLWVITTSTDRDKAQPMLDSARLCAQFLGMPFAGSVWGMGGVPNAIAADSAAIEAAKKLFRPNAEQ